MGQKASDDTCIPLCRFHHDSVENFTGIAKFWNQDIRRAFHQQAIEAVQEAARAIKAGGVRLVDAADGLGFARSYVLDPARAANEWYMRQT